jgi:hypothetical protein
LGFTLLLKFYVRSALHQAEQDADSAHRRGDPGGRFRTYSGRPLDVVHTQAHSATSDPDDPLEGKGHYPAARTANCIIDLLGARNAAALRQLVLDMPTALAAAALGYSPETADPYPR